MLRFRDQSHLILKLIQLSKYKKRTQLMTYLFQKYNHFNIYIDPKLHIMILVLINK